MPDYETPAKHPLQKGDLVELTVTEHIDDNKRFAIMGRFEGSTVEHILARVGEGKDDIREPEIIKYLAECVAEEINRTYGTFRMVRDRMKGGRTSLELKR
jgi:hypothetical protein